MNVAFDVASFLNSGDSTFGLIARSREFYVQDDGSSFSPGEALAHGLFPSITSSEWSSTILLLISLISILYSAGLFVYYTLRHRKRRSSTGRSYRRQTAWTLRQVNICLIPLGLGLVFAFLYLAFK